MSDEADTLSMNVKGLDQLLKALKSSRPPTARIGIIGAKAGPHLSSSKQKTSATNADIGAVHEYGAPSQGIPQRSFLRIPISERLEKEMEQSGALSSEATADVLKEGSTVPWLKKIAILAERIVAGAFDSAGYGRWPAWKNASYTNNANQILVDTQQLRNSITSEVKES